MVGRRLGHRAARPRRRSTRRLAARRRASQRLLGRRSWYCRSMAVSRASSQAQAVALAVAVDEAVLGHPVDLVGDATRVGLEAGEHVLPAAQHVGADRLADARQAVRAARTCGPARAAPTASRGRWPGGRRRSSERCARSVGSWLTWRIAGTGLAERQVVAEGVVLDHRQHDRGGADLEEGGDLGQVGVADDHVQPAVLLGVAVRLVAGVDDRPLERGLEADLLLEEVGPLGELEGHVVGGDARQPRSRPCRRR